MSPGDRIYIENGNGHLPPAWEAESGVVVRVIGCFVIFNRIMDGGQYALPVTCVSPAYEAKPKTGPPCERGGVEACHV